MVKVRKLNILKGSTLTHFIEEVNKIADRRVRLHKVECEDAIEEATKKYKYKEQLDNKVLEQLLHDNAVLKAKLGSKIHG